MGTDLAVKDDMKTLRSLWYQLVGQLRMLQEFLYRDDGTPCGLAEDINETIIKIDRFLTSNSKDYLNNVRKLLEGEKVMFYFSDCGYTRLVVDPPNNRVWWAELGSFAEKKWLRAGLIQP